MVNLNVLNTGCKLCQARRGYCPYSAIYTQLASEFGGGMPGGLDSNPGREECVVHHDLRRMGSAVCDEWVVKELLFVVWRSREGMCDSPEARRVFKDRGCEGRFNEVYMIGMTHEEVEGYVLWGDRRSIAGKIGPDGRAILVA